MSELKLTREDIINLTVILELTKQDKQITDKLKTLLPDLIWKIIHISE